MAYLYCKNIALLNIAQIVARSRVAFQCFAKSALSQQKEIQITKIVLVRYVGGGYIEDEHSHL